MFSIKEGLLNMNADAQKQAINSSATRESAAQISNYQNTTEYLHKTFFESNPSILNNEKLQSGGQVTLMIPSGPYSEEAVMVIAAGPRSFDKEQVKTETIYDYPQDTQRSYWGHIISALASYTETIPQGKEDQYTVLATENCIITRTSDEHRTSRSIALPHSQIFRMNTEHIDDLPEGHAPINHLIYEQKVLRRLSGVATFVNEVESEIFDRTGRDLRGIELRQEQPFGYSFTPSQTGDIDEITRMMEVHQRAYRHTADRWIGRLKEKNQQRLIPQPSYRLYMHLENGIFKVIVSPEFLSFAGVLEAAGIRLSRDPIHPQRIDARDKQFMYHYIKNKVQSFDTAEEAVAD